MIVIPRELLAKMHVVQRVLKNEETGRPKKKQNKWETLSTADE